MNKIIGLCFVVTLICTGCSSTPEIETNYYLLNHARPLDMTQGSASSAAVARPEIVISKIELADYLAQPNLMIALDEQQLHYARFHQWAESLDDAIGKSLIQDLNQASTLHRFIPPQSGGKDQARIKIQIDHFYPDHRSYVILSGSYRYMDPITGVELPSRHFYFELPLQQDGYPYAVSQMRALITQLGEHILAQLEIISPR